MKTLNVVLAIGLHCLIGAGFALAGYLGEYGGPRGWLGLLLWFGGLFLMLDWWEKSPQRIWIVPVVWPFTAWSVELGALTLVGGLVWVIIESRQPNTPRPGTAAYDARLRAVQTTLVTLEAQLRELMQAQQPRPAPVVATAALAPTSAPPPTPARTTPSWSRDFEWADLLGARTLAWAGGVVTVLGILFIFVLAANRGWLLPEIRLVLGAAVSVGVLGAGFWVRRRFGSLYSAVAAAGAGIAGAYATLLAATALYGFISEPVALVAAAGIAAAGAVTALAWSSQTVAALGLLGAMVVPLMVLADEPELSFVGTSFVALMLAGTAAVCLRTGWRDVLLLAGAISLVQIAVLTAQTDGLSWGVVWLAATFWLLYLGIGLAWQLVRGERALEPVAGVFAITGGALATYCSLYLFDEHTAAALFTVAGVYTLLAAAFFRLDEYRDVSSALWSVAVVVGAIAFGTALSGLSLAIAWSAVAVLLAWLARHTKEERLLLPALAYAILGAAYALGHEAEPSQLFVESAHPASGVAGIVAAAAAFAVLAWLARQDRVPRAREILLAVAVTLALYSSSLAVLELFVAVSDFEWGHVALAGLWAGIALCLGEWGLRRKSFELQLGAGALLVFTLLELGAYDWSQLGETKAALSSLLLAGALLLAGCEYGRLADLRERLLPAGVLLTASGGLAALALVSLAEGHWHGIDTEGGVLMLAALAYALPAAALFRSERDLSSALQALALLFALAALALLLSGFWLVLAGALLALALLLASEALGEWRLQAGAAGVWALALLYALGHEAPPSDLFVESAHPGAGVPSLLVLAAVAGVAALRPERFPFARAILLGVTGAIGFYAVSLGILEVAELATDADVATKFQRGHTAVSMFWGLVSLAFLYLGLTRRSWQLRLAGFALFGISLAKLFLYDLAFLSSLTRALSFLAVGAVLLFAGFFYQRLNEQLERQDGAGRVA